MVTTPPTMPKGHRRKDPPHFARAGHDSRYSPPDQHIHIKNPVSATVLADRDAHRDRPERNHTMMANTSSSDSDADIEALIRDMEILRTAPTYKTPINVCPVCGRPTSGILCTPCATRG